MHRALAAAARFKEYYIMRYSAQGDTAAKRGREVVRAAFPAHSARSTGLDVHLALCAGYQNMNSKCRQCTISALS